MEVFMEQELIYAEMVYEDARHNMELRHIDCMKIEEELKHLRTLSELKEKQNSLLNARTAKQYTYLPKKLITEIVY